LFLRRSPRFQDLQQDCTPTNTLFDRLPVELLSQIFSQVDIADLLALQRTSRSFYEVVDHNNSSIVRQFITVHHLDELSKLFPPSVCPTTGVPKYNLRYLLALTNREQICVELSGHLSGKIVDGLIGIPYQKFRVRRRGVEETVVLQQKLSRRMYHLKPPHLTLRLL